MKNLVYAVIFVALATTNVLNAQNIIVKCSEVIELSQTEEDLIKTYYNEHSRFLDAIIKNDQHTMYFSYANMARLHYFVMQSLDKKYAKAYYKTVLGVEIRMSPRKVIKIRQKDSDFTNITKLYEKYSETM